MCSSPHWQVGLSWFREKLSPANREQRLSRWADFAKNCLPRIGSKELPRFREKYRALGRQKMGSNMRPRYIQFRDIRDRDISGLHCIWLCYIGWWYIESSYNRNWNRNWNWICKWNWDWNCDIWYRKVIIVTALKSLHLTTTQVTSDNQNITMMTLMSKFENSPDTAAHLPWKNQLNLCFFTQETIILQYMAPATWRTLALFLWSIPCCPLKILL